MTKTPAQYMMSNIQIDNVIRARNNWRRYRKYLLTGWVTVTLFLLANGIVGGEWSLMKATAGFIGFSLLILIQTWTGFVTNADVDKLLSACRDEGMSLSELCTKLSIACPHNDRPESSLKNGSST